MSNVNIVLICYKIRKKGQNTTSRAQVASRGFCGPARLGESIQLHSAYIISRYITSTYFGVVLGHRMRFKPTRPQNWLVCRGGVCSLAWFSTTRSQPVSFFSARFVRSHQTFSSSPFLGPLHPPISRIRPLNRRFGSVGATQLDPPKMAAPATVISNAFIDTSSVPSIKIYAEEPIRLQQMQNPSSPRGCGCESSSPRRMPSGSGSGRLSVRPFFPPFAFSNISQKLITSHFCIHFIWGPNFVQIYFVTPKKLPFFA